MTVVVRALVLVGVWVAMWSDLSVANVVSGVAVALVVLALDPRERGAGAVRPVAVVRFGLYFSYRLVVSTVVVARTIVFPGNRIHPGIVSVPLEGGSDALATVMAHAISLTPGTLTLEVRRDPLVLFVHALDVRDVDELRAEVRRLEVLAVRAFGTPEAIAGLAVDDMRIWRQR